MGYLQILAWVCLTLGTTTAQLDHTGGDQTYSGNAYGSIELALSAGSPTLYVNVASTATTPDGQSWATAFPHLTDALDAAQSGDQIFVAARTYYPDQGGSTTNDDPDATFLLPDGVGVYGGFAGNEYALDERDVAANPTLLSGDLQQNDTYLTDPNDANFPYQNNGDNTEHVVTLTSGAATLDGFTVQGGNSPTVGQTGGGVSVTGGTLTLNNCTVQHHYGGGLYAGNSAGFDVSGGTFRYNAFGAISSTGLAASQIDDNTNYVKYKMKNTFPLILSLKESLKTVFGRSLELIHY